MGYASGDGLKARASSLRNDGQTADRLGRVGPSLVERSVRRAATFGVPTLYYMWKQY
jgi:hypothetical protein